MPAEMFVDDVIKAIFYLLAFGLFFYVWVLAMCKWYKEVHRLRQEETLREKVQPLLPENYAVDATEKLIEAYWQAWKEPVKDD